MPFGVGWTVFYQLRCGSTVHRATPTPDVMFRAKMEERCGSTVHRATPTPDVMFRAKMEERSGTGGPAGSALDQWLGCSVYVLTWPSWLRAD